MRSPAAAFPFFLAVALTLSVLTLTALVLGRLLMGRLDQAVERWTIPLTLGLAALAHLGLLLGCAGLIRPLPVLLLLGAIHLLAYPVWREMVGAGGSRSALRRPPLLLLLGVLAAVLPSLLLTLYPPTAFDATLYHLPFARSFALSGGLPWLPDLRFPIFPQANEMLFALVMLFAPDVAAHGVQWLMTAVAAALIWAWCRDAFGSSKVGGLAAAIFLGNPVVVHLATSGYVEAGLLLFSTAALYAVRRWRGTGQRRWLVLAAVFAATAATTKYLGLFWLAAIGLVVVCGRLPERPRRARWGGALVFALVAVAVLAPWYGRIYTATGNPVFPYFPGVFGDSEWAPFRFRSFLEAPTTHGVPVEVETPAEVLGSRLVNLVRLPWDLVFEREKYGGQPPYSPLYLALLPLALLAARHDLRQRRLLGLATVYAFVCLGLPGDSRYLIPAVPLVSLAAAGALLPLSVRSARRRFGIAVLCAACVLPGFTYSWYRLIRQGPLPVTSEQREAYLSRRLPLYPAVAYLNRTLGDGYAAWAFHAENMAYFARGRWLGDWVGPASFFRVLAGVQDPRELHQRLRALGAGHLVVPGNVGPLPFPQDAAFERWFEPIYADPGVRIFRLREAPRS